MNYSILMSCKENTTLAPVIFKEHTLGYLFRSGNSLCLGILHASVLRGSPWNSLLTGNVTIARHEMEHLRIATQKDFDDFRVVSNGHLEITPEVRNMCPIKA